jgi:hypothetical protein
MSNFLLDNLKPSYTILLWYLENYTCQVSDTVKDQFIELKNSIEGWKKGTHVRSTKVINVSELERIRENLSLYINQLSVANYSIIEGKIINEIDNSTESQNLLIDLIILNGLPQENNLTLLCNMIIHLKLTHILIQKLENKLKLCEIKKTDSSNYDQMCIDIKHNTVCKNIFILFSMLYNNDIPEINTTKIQVFVDILKERIAESTDKEIVEKYVEIFVDFMKRIDSKLQMCSKVIYKDIHAQFTIWKQAKDQISNRGRFAILDYLDSIEEAELIAASNRHNSHSHNHNHTKEKTKSGDFTRNTNGHNKQRERGDRNRNRGRTQAPSNGLDNK